MIGEIEKWGADEKVQFVMTDQARSQVKANILVEEYFRERSASARDGKIRDLPRLPCLMHTTSESYVQDFIPNSDTQLLRSPGKKNFEWFEPNRDQKSTTR